MSRSFYFTPLFIFKIYFTITLLTYVTHIPNSEALPEEQASGDDPNTITKLAYKIGRRTNLKPISIVPVTPAKKKTVKPKKDPIVNYEADELANSNDNDPNGEGGADAGKKIIIHPEDHPTFGRDDGLENPINSDDTGLDGDIALQRSGQGRAFNKGSHTNYHDDDDKGSGGGGGGGGDGDGGGGGGSDKILQACGDNSVKRLTYLEKVDPDVNTTPKILCGIVNGYDCHESGTGEDSCAGQATCKPFISSDSNSIGQTKFACHCNPNQPARVDEICQQTLFKSNLFFTLMVRPYVSGFQGYNYLQQLNHLSGFLEPFESLFTYVEPSEPLNCPVRFTENINWAVDYFGNLDKINQTVWVKAIGVFDKVTKDLSGNNAGEKLCDMRYPVQCVESEDGGGNACELITNDIFIRTICTPGDDADCENKGFTMWELEYGPESVCNHPSGMNPDIPRIYSFTVKYTKCTGALVCMKDPNSNEILPDGSPAHKCLCPSHLSESECFDVEGSTHEPDPALKTTPFPHLNSTVNCSSETLYSDLKKLHEIRLRLSTLVHPGDICDYGEVSAFQDLLKLSTANPIMDKKDVHAMDLCKTLREMLSHGARAYCNPLALLYCDGEGVAGRCRCMNEFVMNYDDNGAKQCYLMDGTVCGDSWKVKTENYILGLPETSPVCESEICRIKNGKNHRCEENTSGLLMVRGSDSSGSSLVHQQICSSINLLGIVIIWMKVFTNINELLVKQ